MRFVPRTALLLLCVPVVSGVSGVSGVSALSSLSGCVDRTREAARARIQLVVDEQRAADLGCVAALATDDIAKRADVALDCLDKRRVQHERYLGLLTMVPSPSSSEPIPPFPAVPAAIAAAPADGDGKRLFQKNGCAACHSLDGSRLVGQSIKGLYGTTITHTDDSVAVVDDAYLREAIWRPHQRVTKGYLPVMPVYESQLNAATVEVLIAWMKTQK